jgi:hypothetical protein
MTENGHDKQTLLTKRTDSQTDLILLCRLLTDKRKNALPLHFLKFLLPSPHLAHLLLPPSHKPTPRAKSKEPNLTTAQNY